MFERIRTNLDRELDEKRNIEKLRAYYMESLPVLQENFENPIHPYTKSLLSAIPAPNPVVEKNRVALSYDYKTSGIDYNKGTDHLVSGTHYVKCTDEEFKKWTE